MAHKVHRNKTVVAVARELSAFIWELFHQVSAEQQAANQNASLRSKSESDITR